MAKSSCVCTLSEMPFPRNLGLDDWMTVTRKGRVDTTISIFANFRTLSGRSPDDQTSRLLLCRYFSNVLYFESAANFELSG